MASNQNPTENVETEFELAERQTFIEMYEALTRLENNEDFKKIILEGYLREKAVEMTSLLAVPNMQGSRSQIFEALSAISHFENYLNMVKTLGAPAIEDDELE